MILTYLQDFLTGLRRFAWRRAWHGLRQRFREDRLGQTAGSLTFTTTIALVPLFTVILAVFTAFPLFGQFQTVLQRWLVESLIPDSIARQVLGYLTQFTTKASRLGSVGFAALLFSAVALVFTIDRTLNAIWRVRKARPWGQRLLLYWAAITLGPLMVAASLVMMGSVISFSGASVGVPGGAMRWLLDLLQFGLIAVGIAALYKYVPNTHVPWRHALVGGVASSLALELARYLLAIYIGKMATFSLVYGAFATVPILLVWIYTTWVLVLLGAVLVASLPSLLSGVLRDSSAPGWLFELALASLRALQQARSSAQRGLSLADLSHQLKANTRPLEEVMETLVQLDWVGQLSEDDPSRPPRYILLADPERTRVAPLLDRLLLADTAATQAIWAKWHAWRLAEVL